VSNVRYLVTLNSQIEGVDAAGESEILRVHEVLDQRAWSMSSRCGISPV
jgi:hypothetical protein